MWDAVILHIYSRRLGRRWVRDRVSDELAVFDDRSGIHYFLYSIDNFSSGIQYVVDDASYAATIFGGDNALIGSSAAMFWRDLEATIRSTVPAGTIF